MRPLLVLLLAGCALPTTRGQSLEEVFARVQSSVVTVLTESREIDPRRDVGLTSVAGTGSGVLIDAAGQVLTAAHVVHTADAVVVRFADGSEHPADVVASDVMNDVALLRLKSPPPESATPGILGDSDTVRVGRRVFVVGAPRGISHTLTVGHISARRRPSGSVRSVFDTELFQTDAAINKGNSGGPMFDMDGKIIGIVSHIVSRSGGSEGLGFAVTSNVVREVLIDRPAIWSGVEFILASGDLARVLNVPGDRSGILVQHIAKNSPGEKLGLQGGRFAVAIAGQEIVLGGDIILEVQDIAVDSLASFKKIQNAVRTVGDGSELKVLILRGGKIKTLRWKVER